MKTYSNLVLFACFNTSILLSQVGIGTNIPTAELEIQTSNSGIPALELNPQTAPVGSVTGQISLIGDKLFMYDATRVKWLSIESSALQYGYEGSADDVNLWFGGDVENNDSGALMPFDGTIVYVSVQSSGGNNSKRMDLRINGTNVGNDTDASLDGRFNLEEGSFTYTHYNIDFNKGDFLSMRAARNGSSVSDPTAIIWVKWR